MVSIEIALFKKGLTLCVEFFLELPSSKVRIGYSKVNTITVNYRCLLMVIKDSKDSAHMYCSCLPGVIHT